MRTRVKNSIWFHAYELDKGGRQCLQTHFHADMSQFWGCSLLGVHLEAEYITMGVTRPSQFEDSSSNSADECSLYFQNLKHNISQKWTVA